MVSMKMGRRPLYRPRLRRVRPKRKQQMLTEKDDGIGRQVSDSSRGRGEIALLSIDIMRMTVCSIDNRSSGGSSSVASLENAKRRQR